MTISSRTNKTGAAAHKARLVKPETEYEDYKEITAGFPEKFQPFFQPCRHKIVYGGRGGAKSWSIARALLLMGSQKILRIICARELMQSIQDSVHRLLSDQIFELGLQDFYEIEKLVIRGKAPDPEQPTRFTEFRFMGLKSNPQQIKSFEAADIIWIEEAANVSAESIRLILPTLRGDQAKGRSMDSEIWISFNPEHEDDPVYQTFVLNPRPNSIIVKMDYTDNPYCPQVLLDEAEYMKAHNYAEYKHIWEGECIKHFEGSVYLNEIKEATLEGRFTAVKYDPSCPVEAFFDLGWNNSTAIWFAQRVGPRINILLAHEQVGKSSEYWVTYIKDCPFPVKKVHLPHDARQHHGGLSWEEQFRTNFPGQVSIVKNIGITNGINAAKLMFPMMYFDKVRCEDGINSLTRYRFEVSKDGKGVMHSKPVHDRHSNFADAFRYLAVALRPESEKPKSKYASTFGNFSRGGSNSWMAI